jgi:hypothetical protein
MLDFECEKRAPLVVQLRSSISVFFSVVSALCAQKEARIRGAECNNAPQHSNTQNKCNLTSAPPFHRELSLLCKRSGSHFMCADDACSCATQLLF